MDAPPTSKVVKSQKDSKDHPLCLTFLSFPMGQKNPLVDEGVDSSQQ